MRGSLLAYGSAPRRLPGTLGHAAMAPRIDGIKVHGWYRLDEAWLLPEVRAPGVYMLAHFTRRPRSVDPSSKRIIYIGETCGQTLWLRWKQFASSAFSNRSGHSGGFTYFASFAREHYPTLAVAFVAPADEEPLRTYKIRYIERKWLLNYVQAHGAPPACNRK